jgi:hypothetical protein
MTELYDLDKLAEQIDSVLEARNSEATEFLLYFMQHTIDSLQLGGSENPTEYFCQGLTAMVDCREPFVNYVIYMASESSPGVPGDKECLADQLDGWLARVDSSFRNLPHLFFPQAYLLEKIPRQWWLQVAEVYLQALSEQEPRIFVCPNPLA